MATTKATKLHPAIAPFVREEQKKRDAEIRSSQAWRDRQPLATTKATEIRRANEVKCVFVSVWDGDVTLRSRACLHKDDHSVEVLETHDVDGLEHLDKEYVVMPDGEELRVCPECHEYVLKHVMVEGVGKSLHETEECPNPDCPNKA